MAAVTTHVLDTARGLPGDGIVVELFRIGERGERAWLARTVTNEDGRTDAPLAVELPAGTYEIVFEVAEYFERQRTRAFYEDIAVRFAVAPEARHYHVPLLLSPWGYSTYRGS